MTGDDGARVGVDVGGTFTDLVHVGADGSVGVAKVPSTPDDQAEGILAAATDAGVDAPALARFAHGTTVATNTVLERDGADVVLVTTAGFRDLLEIARQDRPDLYRQDVQRPAPLVPRDRVVEADERVGAGGEVVRPLTDEAVAAVVEQVAALRPEAVAVSLLFSFAHPAHEERLADALAARLDVPVSRSSLVLPTFREYERTSTTALDAYVAPRLDRYLRSLEARLADVGLARPVEVMRSGGGTITAAAARARPVETLLSGPAAGAWGAAAVAARAGLDDVVALDVGGTSTDVTLVRGGAPELTAEATVAGLPFGVATTDVHTIGSGGGSVAWLDRGRSLRVGPRSSGAVPGPACYGRGGTEATVTDADVVLGRLPAQVRLGGALELDAAAAQAALGRLADALAGTGAGGWTARRAAAGVVRVVEAQMVAALRVVTVERGHDPRRLALVPFGGAGALHQAALARALGMRQVLVPANAGVLAAVGLLAAPMAADAVRTRLVALDDLDPATVVAGLAGLRDDVAGRLADQGVDRPRLQAAVDLRYAGQGFELAVDLDAAVLGEPDAGQPAVGPVPDGVAAVPGDGWRDVLRSAFDEAHARRYGYAQPDEPVELVNLRVRGTGRSAGLPPATVAAVGDAAAATVAVTTLPADAVDVDDPAAGDALVEVPVVERGRLGVGAEVRGPAVVTAVDTTVWVAPWQRAEVDEHGNLRLEEAS